MRLWMTVLYPSIIVSAVLTTPFLTLAGQPEERKGDQPASPISRQQVEADWLQQDVVRNLPPAEPYRPNNTPLSTGEDAAGAVDGVKDGTYGFHTERDPKPWWQVDLGESVKLDRIVIFNRGDGNVEDRAGRVSVLLSDDGAAWKELYRHDGSKFFGQPDGKPLSVPADGATARFVRLQLPDPQYFHLDEVEVFRMGGSQNIALGKAADQSSVSTWSTRSPQVVPAQAVEPAEPEYPIANVVARGLRLVDSLRRLNVDVRTHERTLRQISDAVERLSDNATAEGRRELYLQARWTVRKLALSNPRLDFDDLLFVKRVPGSFTHMSDQYYGWWSRPGGGLYVLQGFKSDRPALRCLSSSLPAGSFLRPDISYDGTRVLFAYCKHYPDLGAEADKLNKANVAEDAFYHLYEMNVDGTGLRRVTHGKYDDFDGRYLPNGEIVFLSTRRGQSVQCGSDENLAIAGGELPDCYVRCGGGLSRPVAVYTLHVMDADGDNLRQISPFEMFEWTPSVDHHGRIVYARWDYVDRHNMPYMSLWSTLPDGSNAQAVFGNFTRNPHCVFEARAIPDSHRFIFTASAHHAFTGGSLVLLDPSRARDGEAAMTRLTPEVVFPESEGWPQTYFANPYPLSEEHHLVAWSAAPLPPGTPRPQWGMPGPPNDLGLYLFDAFGNLDLVYRDPDISSMYPLPIRPRTRPPSVSQVANRQGPQEGRLSVIDVYKGLDSVARGSIRQLRLVGVPVKTHPTMNFPSIGLTRDDPGKFVMGTVPVEKDGSAYFRVPSGVTFFLQAVDADGMAVQTMRSATYLQPGESNTCVGCHEPRNTAPPVRSPLALQREPSKITPGPDGSWPLDFGTLLGSVLETRCVECHKPGADGKSFDLTPDKAYDSLVNYGRPSLREHVLARYAEGRSTAGACAARVSPLVKLLDAGHYDVRLKPDERTRLLTWIDTYAQRQGSFSPDQEERLRSLRSRMASLLVE